MRAFVTVIGKDKVGIIAAVCNLLAEKKANVLDISQTILQENFTMIMLVDISACSVSFDEMSRLLSELGSSMELSIRIQREEIFNAMHRI
ncbi:MAG: ACT domain-containing protein [Oscillospiraceae bacterium]|nr:ACT domain-containing protein [Oscillospiraceae bacterium]